MLQTDPKKLRWCGIDMRSRLRRRIAVVFTVAVFLFGSTLLITVSEAHASLNRYHAGFWSTLLLLTCCSLGVLRPGGVVKPFRQLTFRMKGIGEVVTVNGLDELAEYRFGSRFDALNEERQTAVLNSYRVGSRFFPAKASKAPSVPTQRICCRLDERVRRRSKALRPGSF
jgi:hypothetical protein